MATNDWLKDAAYVTVGLGVVGFQRAQVRRHEMRKRLDSQLELLRGNVQRATDTADTRLRDIEGRLESVQTQIDEMLSTVEARVDSVLDELEGRLPEQAREVLAVARRTGREAQAQIRDLVRPNGRVA